jgi:hypothetical protein
MSLSTLFKGGLAIVAVILLTVYLRDPHRTRLPFGSTDLSPVQKQLARLSTEERQLVESYVKRSRGDVLTPAMADPDDPLTARTFGEAIELERRWNQKMAGEQARMAAFKEQREARLAPLRALVQVSLAKAEVLSGNDYRALRDPAFYQKPHGVDEKPVFVTRLSIQNLGDVAIAEFSGSLKAHDSNNVLPMDLCWVDLRREIQPHSDYEIVCGDGRQANQQQKDFVEDTSGRFEVYWEPRHVKLADGTEVDSGL